MDRKKLWIKTKIIEKNKTEKIIEEIKNIISNNIMKKIIKEN